MPTDGSEQFLCRGVHAKHPAYADALAGTIVPGDVGGYVSPEEHNLRYVSTHSPYTSWTRCRAVAENFALSSGPGGLLLRVQSGAPAAEDTWRWEASPDHWMEDEILLKGVRMGAEVIRL
jgi:hypothetical protein